MLAVSAVVIVGSPPSLLGVASARSTTQVHTRCVPAGTRLGPRVVSASAGATHSARYVEGSPSALLLSSALCGVAAPYIRLTGQAEARPNHPEGSPRQSSSSE